MVSGYTSRKRLEKQNPGENSNTWGGFLNLNTIDLIDECFGAVCVAFSTAGDITLSQQNGLTDEGRNSVLILTGTPTSAVRLFVPAVESFYFVRNKMAGSQRVRITNQGGTTGVDFSGAGSGAEQGAIITDGTHVREIFRTVSAGSLGIFTKGMIMPFFNSVGAIPSGWANCDGTNGTPNLNDRFILGTVSVGNVDTSGGSLALTAASNANDHAHGGITGSTVLTSANIPAHSHFLFAAVNLDAGTAQLRNAPPTGKAAIEGDGTDGYTIAGAVTTAAVSHGQSSWAYTSAPTGHTHTITSGGGHTHTIADGRPPFHRMYYIMKL